MAEQSSVDEASLSPIERQESLEKHLQTRPEAKDLKDRHILLDTNAAPYGPPPIFRFVMKKKTCSKTSLTLLFRTQRPASQTSGAGTQTGNR